jgi:hypothetical protein
MIVKIRWGDPIWPESHKVAIIDTSKKAHEAPEGLGYIFDKIKYSPQNVRPEAKYSDGLNTYTVLQVSGQRLHPGCIYTSQNPPIFKPVTILHMMGILGIRFYLCEIGYQGDTNRCLKSEKSLLNHLSGKS